MRSKTKIIVLHLRELIYTGVFILLGILFLTLLVILFLPEKQGEKPSFSDDVKRYVPGKYTTCLQLGEGTVDVEVVVDASCINSIQLVNLSEVISTMYPLVEPCFASIADQICESQTLEGITYPEENKYTSQLLLSAIEATLQKASLSSGG